METYFEDDYFILLVYVQLQFIIGMLCHSAFKLYRNRKKVLISLYMD
jgi:hypothetical protein